MQSMSTQNFVIYSKKEHFVGLNLGYLTLGGPSYLIQGSAVNVVHSTQSRGWLSHPLGGLILCLKFPKSEQHQPSFVAQLQTS